MKFAFRLFTLVSALGIFAFFYFDGQNYKDIQKVEEMRHEEFVFSVEGWGDIYYLENIPPGSGTVWVVNSDGGKKDLTYYAVSPPQIQHRPHLEQIVIEVVSGCDECAIYQSYLAINYGNN